MTDRPASPDSDAPEPPEIADVRRLLAEARHTAPMPDDQVARMERVIAGLGDETAAGGSEPGPDADVVPIAVHRRRRAAALLVAAAAVVVGGVALGPHLAGGPADSPSGASAQDSGAGDSGYQPSKSPSTPEGGKSPDRALSGTASIRHGRVVVRPQQFPSAALQGRHLLARRTKAMEMLDMMGLRGCSGLPQDAAAVPAEYEHAPAALVYRRAVGSSQVVDLYVCGSSRPIRSTTLPAP